MARIYVLGSLNVDLVVAAPRPVQPGETIAGGDLRTIPGGKGANQAVAAARLGADVQMAGAVGRDAYGDLLLASLSGVGADVSRVSRVDRPTGAALISVYPSGENSITIAPGANAAVTPEAARAALSGIGSGDFLLCQLETPLGAVEAGLAAARAAGATTILDPAPARPLPDRLLALVDVLTPNQTEAALLTDSAGAVETARQAEAAAQALRRRGPSVVIVKMGAAGCLVVAEGLTQAVPAPRVEAIDTTAAGDVFNAAFAVARLEGKDWKEAARFAAAAGAVSVTRAGAQPSAPTRAEVLALL